MTRTEIIQQLNEIFRDTLENADIELTDASCADDIEEWDSLTHIQLIVAVENHFHIKFTSKEILRWANVGQMIDSILSKLN